MGEGEGGLMADDTLKEIRHPDARHKTRNRSGQVAGASKRHIADPFNWRLVEMQKGTAYRVLSLSARKIMDRLEIELAQHGFKPEENGFLPCTYEDFVEYGVHRHAISPAIRELVALGFVDVSRKGSAGNAEHRQATLFLLTYRPSGSDVVTKNSWRRILSLEEAEAVARAARAGKADRRASEFGRLGAKSRWAKVKQPPVMETAPTKNRTPVMETVPRPVMETALKPSDGNRTEGGKSPVMETVPLSIFSRGGGTSSGGADAPTALHAMVAKLPPPRWVRIAPGIGRELNRIIDNLHRQAPMDALTALEGLILSHPSLPIGCPSIFLAGR